MKLNSLPTRPLVVKITLSPHEVEQLKYLLGYSTLDGSPKFLELLNNRGELPVEILDFRYHLYHGLLELSRPQQKLKFKKHS